jgi:hypothetical protein
VVGGESTVYYDGIVHEIITFDGYITTSQRQQIEGYLAWKWGLNGGSLPSLSVASFTPTQISGCAFWLDAADSNSMTLQSTATLSQYVTTADQSVSYTGTLSSLSSFTGGTCFMAGAAVSYQAGVLCPSSSNGVWYAATEGNTKVVKLQFTLAGAALFVKGLSAGYNASGGISSTNSGATNDTAYATYGATSIATSASTSSYGVASFTMYFTTSTGSYIYRLNDKSASSNALTVSTTMPTYTSNYRNGKGAIAMAGTSFISNSTFSFGLANRSVFIVAEQTSSAGNNSFQGILSMGGSATIEDWTNSNAIAYTGRGSNGFQNMSFSIVANNDYIQNYGVNTAPAPFALYADVFSGTSGTLYINGTSNSTDTTANAVGTSVGFTIGARKSLSSTPTGLLNGYIYEIILYNSALTTTQRQQVETYLMNKWGMNNSNLPSTHPYQVIKP